MSKGLAHTTGHSTACGADALQINSGSYNIAVGNSAGFSLTGDYNIGVGEIIDSNGCLGTILLTS